jgi:diketogulonate reductase-like aldo/keto reductase
VTDLPDVSRRRLLRGICTAAALLNLSPRLVMAAEPAAIIKRKIPATGEELAVMGMGTWMTFDVGDDPKMLTQLHQVLQTFFDDGGEVIDTSPMYGSAQAVIGDLLREVRHPGKVFTATKVWIYGKKAGIDQMKESMDKLGVSVVDLMQVHNLRDWKTHLETLRNWKDKGRIRYIGMTTSHGRSHDELVHIMKEKKPDFVQFSYSMGNREAEKVLFPVAADKGIATLINRPFQGGGLFNRVKGRPLPGWAAEIGCKTWAQVFLKYIISHPGVTGVIPATSRVDHMRDNMAAGYAPLPDAALRRRMEMDFEKV